MSLFFLIGQQAALVKQAENPLEGGLNPLTTPIFRKLTSPGPGFMGIKRFTPQPTPAPAGVTERFQGLATQSQNQTARKGQVVPDLAVDNWGPGGINPINLRKGRSFLDYGGAQQDMFADRQDAINLSDPHQLPGVWEHMPIAQGIRKANNPQSPLHGQAQVLTEADKPVRRQSNSALEPYDPSVLRQLNKQLYDESPAYFPLANPTKNPFE